MGLKGTWKKIRAKHVRTSSVRVLWPYEEHEKSKGIPSLSVSHYVCQVGRRIVSVTQLIHAVTHLDAVQEG